jgi:hypothetical protein
MRGCLGGERGSIWCRDDFGELSAVFRNEIGESLRLETGG